MDSDKLEDAGSGPEDAQDDMEEEDKMPLCGPQQVEGSSARSTSASPDPHAIDPAEGLEPDRNNSETEGKIDFNTVKQAMPDVGRLEISVTASSYIDFNDLASLSTLQLVGSIANPAFTANQVNTLRTELKTRIKHGRLSIQPDGWDYSTLPASRATSYWGSEDDEDEEMEIDWVEGEGAKTLNKGDEEVVQRREEAVKKRAKVQKGKEKAAHEPGNTFLEALYTDKELHDLMRTATKCIPERLKMPSPSDLNKMDPSTMSSKFPGLSDIMTARIHPPYSASSPSPTTALASTTADIAKANRLILFLSQYLVKFDPLACAGTSGKHFVMLDLDRLHGLSCSEDEVSKLDAFAAPSDYSTPTAGKVKKGIVMSLVKCGKALAFKRLHLLVRASALLRKLGAEIQKDKGFGKLIDKVKKDLIDALISACTTRATHDSVTVEARARDKSFIECVKKTAARSSSAAHLSTTAPEFEHSGLWQRLSLIFRKLIIEPAVKTARAHNLRDAPKKTRTSDALSTSPRPSTDVPVRNVIIGTINRAQIASCAPAVARFTVQYSELERKCLLNPSPRFVLVDRDGAPVSQPKLNWSIYKEARAMPAKHLVAKFEELIKKASASSALFYILRKLRTGTRPPSGKQTHKPFHQAGAGTVQTELYTVYLNPMAKASKNPIDALPKKATAMDPQNSSNEMFNVIKGLVEKYIKKAEDETNKIDGKRVKELLTALDNVLGWSAGQGATLTQRPNIRLVMDHIVVIRCMLSALADDKIVKLKDAQNIYSTYKLLLLAASSFKNPVAWFLGLEGIFDTAMEGVKMTRELQMSLAQIVLYARTDMSIMLFMSDQQTVIGKFGSSDNIQTDFHATMVAAQKRFCARADCSQPIELMRLAFPLRKPGRKHDLLATSARFGRRGFSLEVLDIKSMGVPLDVITCATGPCPWNYAYHKLGICVGSPPPLRHIEHVTCKNQRDRVVLLVGAEFVKAEEAPEDEEDEFVDTEEESGNENNEDKDAKFNNNKEVKD